MSGRGCGEPWENGQEESAFSSQSPILLSAPTSFKCFYSLCHLRTCTSLQLYLWTSFCNIKSFHCDGWATTILMSDKIRNLRLPWFLSFILFSIPMATKSCWFYFLNISIIPLSSIHLLLPQFKHKHLFPKVLQGFLNCHFASSLELEFHLLHLLSSLKFFIFSSPFLFFLHRPSLGDLIYFCGFDVDTLKISRYVKDPTISI